MQDHQTTGEVQGGAGVVYELLADSWKYAAVTGRKANISRKIGGTFSTGGDEVSGVQC